MNLAAFCFEPIRVHKDPRGWVLEPLDQAALQLLANAHLVVTGPGQVRGNHYHLRGAEVAVLMGPGLVRVRIDGQTQDVQIPPDQAYRFVFPPRVPHAMQNTGSHLMVMIAFNTEVHDPAAPDVVRELLIEPGQGAS